MKLPSKCVWLVHVPQGPLWLLVSLRNCPQFAHKHRIRIMYTFVSGKLGVQGLEK